MSAARADDIALANRLADAAGAAIRPYFRTVLAIEEKDDDSPVTLADRAGEAAMRAIVAAERPRDGMIGEEYGAEREDAERIWVFDPIDGTRAFVTGRPIFGTLIALLERGRPVLGLIDQPVARERWLGAPDAGGTTFNGAPVRTRPCAGLASARLATTSPWLFDAAGFHAMQRLRPRVRDVIYGGDCYNYGLVAHGQLDLVIEQGLKLHDWAALVPVVEGAGGVMRDWSGRPLTLGSAGSVVACGDPALLDEVLTALPVAGGS